MAQTSVSPSQLEVGASTVTNTNDTVVSERSFLQSPNKSATGASSPQAQRPSPSSGSTRPRRKKARPTHFLALQVSQAPQVIEAIQRVQAAILQHSPQLRAALADAAAAHITLGVMALHSDDDRQAAMDTLEGLAEPLSQQGLLAPVQLELQGLSHFENQVLFLGIRQSEAASRLKQLQAAAQHHFAGSGIEGQDSRPFTPHITIAKLSQMRRAASPYKRRKSEPVEIPSDAYRELVDIDAGAVVIPQLQLCQMQNRPRGKYYRVMRELRLGGNEHRLEALKQCFILEAKECPLKFHQ